MQTSRCLNYKATKPDQQMMHPDNPTMKTQNMQMSKALALWQQLDMLPCHTHAHSQSAFANSATYILYIEQMRIGQLFEIVAEMMLEFLN